MVGVSSRTLLWRAFSHFVIFLYLFNEKTSMLVVVPAAIGTIIEVRIIQISANYNNILHFATHLCYMFHRRGK